MKPIVSCRSAANWLSVIRPVSRPAIVTEPFVGRSRPPMMLSSVDLPLPLGPIRQTNSPGITVRSASTSARTTSSPSWCSFHAPRTSTTGASVAGTVSSTSTVDVMSAS